jgi:hypothetical protein
VWRRRRVQLQLFADWHAKLESARRNGERRRSERTLTGELQLANEELKALRRAKLKAFLETEHKLHRAELAKRGLAILHDEP